jgi:membrane protein YqaA with SNARE-associated domain
MNFTLRGQISRPARRRVDVAIVLFGIQPTRHVSHTTSFNRTLRHLGAFGLFFLAIVDGSPLPTFGGPDILTAVLSASHRNPWWEYALVATAGAVIGALITFHIARKAGTAYLEKFAHSRIKKPLHYFQRYGTGALAVSCAVPFPFPTSFFFAVAGASEYPEGRFIAVVLLCRGVRYAIIAFVAERLGRHFLTIVRHPDRYWGWLLLIAVIVAALAVAGVKISKRLSADEEAREQPEAA